MILVELGVNTSIEEYATQAGEHQSAPIFVTQRTK